MREVFATLALLLTVLGNQRAAAVSYLSDAPVQAVHAEGLGVASVLREVSRETNMTIGLEMDLVLGQESHVRLDFPGGTISDLATMCATLVKGGAWRIIDSHNIVISAPGEASELASIPISHPGASSSTRRQVWSDLSSRPEITNWLSHAGCRRSELFTGHEWQGDAPRISITRRTMTLEQLLNSAAAASANDHFWSVLKNTREGQCEVIITLW